MTPEDSRLLFLALRELEYLERRDRAREIRAAGDAGAAADLLERLAGEVKP